MGCLYKFPGVSIPGVNQTEPAIDAMGNRCIIPLFDDGSRGVSPIIGVRPKVVVGISGTTVDLTNVNWSSAVLALRGSDYYDSGEYYQLDATAQFSKSTRKIGIETVKSVAAYIGFVWTIGHSSLLTPGIDLYIYAHGE